MASQSLGSIVSLIPGRMRVRLAQRRRTPAALHQLECTFGGLEGVNAVTTNPASGSVLVLYDPEVLSTRRLLRLSSDLGLVDETNTIAESGDWRSKLSPGRLADGAAAQVRAELYRSVTRAALYMGAAILGGRTAAALGISSRLGSISAAAVILLLSKLNRRLQPRSRR